MTATHVTTIHKNKHRHHFIDDIIETPLPKQCEAFTLEWYDGEHIQMSV